MKITDLAAIAEIAREGRAQRDDRLRRDVRDAGAAAAARLRHRYGGHSTTKYIGGHSDVVGGALITRQRQLPVRARAEGAAVWRRGAVAVRLLADAARNRYAAVPGAGAFGERGAGRLRLQAHPAVEAVHYPGLPDHPGHEIAARQMSASAGCCRFRCAAAGRRRWGWRRGAAVHTGHQPGRGAQPDRASRVGGGPQNGTPQNLLRLSVGLEHADDLIADLEQALAG